MENLTQQLDNAEAITFPVWDKLHTFRVVPITSQSGGKTFHHLVMYDPKLVAEFTTEPWDMDGTFDGRPNIRNCEQLFTVLAIKDVEIPTTMPDGTTGNMTVRKVRKSCQFSINCNAFCSYETLFFPK